MTSLCVQGQVNSYTLPLLELPSWGSVPGVLIKWWLSVWDQIHHFQSLAWLGSQAGKLGSFSSYLEAWLFLLKRLRQRLSSTVVRPEKPRFSTLLQGPTQQRRVTLGSVDPWYLKGTERVFEVGESHRDPSGREQKMETWSPLTGRSWGKRVLDFPAAFPVTDFYYKRDWHSKRGPGS